MDLEIKIGDPVDQVEQTECRGKEDAGVRVYLGDADVQAPVPPGSRAAVLEAAEEAGAVLPVQTLVAVLLVTLLPVRGVVHLDGRGRARADVHRGRLLLTEGDGGRWGGGERILSQPVKHNMPPPGASSVHRLRLTPQQCAPGVLLSQCSTTAIPIKT